MADSQYSVNINVKVQDGASKPAAAAASALKKLGKAAKDTRLAESLGKGSDLAKVALGNLDKALISGKINLETYEKAAKGVQTSFGLVSPASQKAAAGLKQLDRQLEAGEISADEYQKELAELGREMDRTGGEAKESAKGLSLVEKATAALGAAMAAKQVAEYAIELTRLGAESQRQAASLDNLAAAAGTSGDEIVGAIRAASDFTIDRMTAMQAANKAMVMEVAQTPEEFERLTRVATALGRAMGQDAATSISDFTTAAARQSQQIADNLGLTVTIGKATERFAKANNIAADSMTDAQRKAAFLAMMLEEGEKKMAQLGDGALDNAGKIEQATSTWKTFTGVVGEGFSEAVLGSTGDLGKLNQALDENSGVVSKSIELSLKLVTNWANAPAVVQELIDTIKGEPEPVMAAARAQMLLSGEVADSSRAHELLRGEVEKLEVAEEGATAVQNMATRKLEERSAAQDELAQSAFGMSEGVSSSAIEMARNVIESADKAKQATDELAAAMDITVQLNLSMGFTRQAESEKEAAARIAVDKEKIESEHLEKMTAIQAKGASRAVRLDVASEQEKLATRQFAMDQAQLKVDEMTGKERESAQNAKQQTLTIATQKYAEQQKLLEDYSAGRLVIAGQNTDALIAEEQRRYQEALKIQEAEEAKQAKDQKKAQGEMLIQAVDTWASQEDLPPEMTKKVAEMRVNIAEEYGMVAEGSAALVADILGELDAWASGAKVTTGELVGYFGDVISATDDTQGRLINLTASEYVIKVRYEMSGQILDPETGQPTKVRKPKKPGEPEEFAHGGSFMVGEAGAEMVTVQPVGRGGDSIYNDTFNVYDGNSMAAVQENRRRQRRGGIARTM